MRSAKRVGSSLVSALASFSILASCEDETTAKSKTIATTMTPDGRKLSLVYGSHPGMWGHFGDRQCSNTTKLEVTGAAPLLLDSASAGPCSAARKNLANAEGAFFTREEGDVLFVAAEEKEVAPGAWTAYVPRGLGVLRAVHYAGDSGKTALAKMKSFDDYLSDRLRAGGAFYASAKEPTPGDSLVDVFTTPERVRRHAESLTTSVRDCRAPKHVNALLLEVNEAVALPALFEGAFACPEWDAENAASERTTDIRPLLLEKKPAKLVPLLLTDLVEKKHPRHGAWLGALAAALGATEAAPHLEGTLVWPEDPTMPEEPRYRPWLDTVRALSKLDPARGANQVLNALARLPENDDCVLPKEAAPTLPGSNTTTRQFASSLGATLTGLRSPDVEKRLLAMMKDGKVALTSRQITRIILTQWKVTLPKDAPPLSQCQKERLAGQEWNASLVSDAGPTARDASAH